jgi:hypothetical protein
MTEADESTDLTSPMTTTTAFWEKTFKKILGSKIHVFYFTIHQENPCSKKMRLWHNL